ncbi:MAG: beta-ketoacyl synthase chain length factor [Sediminibacterium sp.]
MFYIHQTKCISPQESFSAMEMTSLHESIDNKLTVIEPAYTGVATGLLRRMGKAGRIGMGAAMPLLQQGVIPNGIIIGTANGGMEESIRFLKQIIEYNEDMLAPGSFVQSTANAIASQLGILTQNKGYNITHVHKALAFENAIIDATMLLKENPANTYLLGGVDEIASYNFNIEFTAGWYKKEKTTNKDLYNTNTAGSMAGEGAAMFMVSNEKENALAELKSLTVLHSGDSKTIKNQLKDFIQTKIPAGEKIDLFLTGENGDNRYTALFSACDSLMDNDTTIARYKHMCGEYPTAAAFALWLSAVLPINQTLPAHMVKRQGNNKEIRNVLIYNFHQGAQHSFMFLSKLK